jgi:hypothetical protein
LVVESVDEEGREKEREKKSPSQDKKIKLYDSMTRPGEDRWVCQSATSG